MKRRVDLIRCGFASWGGDPCGRLMGARKGRPGDWEDPPCVVGGML